MASASKRDGADRYTAYWRDEHGRNKQKQGFADYKSTYALAMKNEDECRKIAEGLIDPSVRTRQKASARPLRDHVAEYRKSLEDKENTPDHCRHVASALKKLFEAGEIRTPADLTSAKIVAALARRRETGISARTLNHALGAAKAFCRWLADDDRIERFPKGLKDVEKFNEKADQRYVRRALTIEEVNRLFAAVEQGGPILAGYGPTKSKHSGIYLSGPERAALYRLAMATGFRANELRQLTPEGFRLDGPEPYITIRPKDEKRRKGTDQPITTAMADAFRPFVTGKPPGGPVLFVPDRTAEMLRRDLEAVGIPYETPDGLIDFHALRATYATHLIESGANPKIVMVLMRVSSLDLVARYTKTTAAGARDALGRSGK